MTNKFIPELNDLKALFSDDLEPTRDWVHDQLVAKAELMYGEHSYVNYGDVEYDSEDASAPVYARGCHCCPDDVDGHVSMTLDEILEVLVNPGSTAEAIRVDKEAKRVALEAEQALNLKRIAIAKEKAERLLLSQLKGKYE